MFAARRREPARALAQAGFARDLPRRPAGAVGARAPTLGKLDCRPAWHRLVGPCDRLPRRGALAGNCGGCRVRIHTCSR
eukprot:2855440-Prymnesium_polylepis.2